MVAASVVAAVESPHEGCKSFNIHNFHDGDGCSLDAFVDWIESAGYPVTRIQDHSEWFSRFSDKLNVLPDEQKQHSALDVLGAYGRPYPAADASSITTHNFMELVKNWSLGAGVPHIDENFIHKCLSDMKLLGMLSDPDR